MPEMKTLPHCRQMVAWEADKTLLPCKAAHGRDKKVLSETQVPTRPMSQPVTKSHTITDETA